jgi:hypothetical protein
MRFGEPVEQPAATGYCHALAHPGNRHLCTPMEATVYRIDEPTLAIRPGPRMPPLAPTFGPLNGIVVERPAAPAGGARPGRTKRDSPVLVGFVSLPAPQRLGLATALPHWELAPADADADVVWLDGGAVRARLLRLVRPARLPGSADSAVIVGAAILQAPSHADARRFMRQLASELHQTPRALTGARSVGDEALAISTGYNVAFVRGATVVTLANLGRRKAAVLAAAVEIDRALLSAPP